MDEAELQAIRDRLPVVRTWEHTYRGRVTDVTVAYRAWPHVIIILGTWSTSQRSTSHGVKTRGVFARTGACGSSPSKPQTGVRSAPPTCAAPA